MEAEDDDAPLEPEPEDRSRTESLEIQQVAPLNAVEKATAAHRSTRNIYLHRGESVDIGGVLGSDEYDMLTLVAFADALSKRPIAEAGFFDAAFHLQLYSLVPKMESERTSLSVIVLDLFDQLAPIYQSTSQRLHAAVRRSQTL